MKNTITDSNLMASKPAYSPALLTYVPSGHQCWVTGRVAQLVERRAQDAMTPVINDPSSNPARSTRKQMMSVFRVKNVVLTRCRRAQPPVCIIIHARVRMISYAC